MSKLGFELDGNQTTMSESRFDSDGPIRFARLKHLTLDERKKNKIKTNQTRPILVTIKLIKAPGIC